MNEKTPQSQDQRDGAMLTALLKQRLGQLLMQQEVISYQATICKMKFDEAVAKGFSELQALEICTKQWNY